MRLTCQTVVFGLEGIDICVPPKIPEGVAFSAFWDGPAPEHPIVMELLSLYRSRGGSESAGVLPADSRGRKA
jgi:hypothetical protein